MSDLISRKVLLKEIELSMMDNPHIDEKVRANHNTEHQHFLHMVSRQPIEYDENKIRNIHVEYMNIINKITNRFNYEQLQHERFANFDDEYSALHGSKISAFGDAINIVNQVVAESMEEIKKTGEESLVADSTCQ